MILVKRLPQTDLVVFKGGTTARSHQSALTLNRRWFENGWKRGPTGSFRRKEFDVSVITYGPEGREGKHLGVRTVKCLRQASGADWRLRGGRLEPGDDRFLPLEAGDLMAVRIGGIRVPRSVDVLLIDSDAPQDHLLAREFSDVRARSPRFLTHEEWVSKLDRARVPSSHSSWAFGGGAETEISRAVEASNFREISQEELKRRLERQRQTGRMAEDIVVGFLRQKFPTAQVDHIALRDATHPFDIDVVMDDGRRIHVEVKGTSQEHQRPFWISRAEIDFAATAEVSYVLARASRVVPDDGDLQFALAGAWAAEVQAGMDVGVGGVHVASLRIEPTGRGLQWRKRFPVAGH